MKRTYFCPKCAAVLNPNVKIVLAAVRHEHRGLVLLSPQPGNYQAIVPDDLGLRGGDLVEFHCPVCAAPLTASHDENLAGLRFRFSTGLEGKVYFSRRFGEHATFFVADDEVKTYGEHAATQQGGVNFFGAGGEDW
ncbi:MAG: hypothetical protein ABIO70_14395 [Pseudomonadota bacterium]